MLLSSSAALVVVGGQGPGTKILTQNEANCHDCREFRPILGIFLTEKTFVFDQDGRGNHAAALPLLEELLELDPTYGSLL